MQADRLRLSLVLAAALVTGCSIGPSRDGGPAQHVDVSHIADAVPRREPLSRFGNPATYTVAGQRYHVLSSRKGFVERGVASWYGTKFHGRRTSNGETYDMYGMTAAHRTLPLPTYVRVTNLDNDRTVVVRVNDRGPFHSDRIIDLSYAAASRLGLLGRGTGNVEVRAIDPDEPAVITVDTGAVNVQPAVFTANAALMEPVSLAPEAVPVATNVPAAPAAPQKPSGQTSSETTTRRLYLQVGAFAERHNAEQLRERLVHVAIDSAAVHANDDAIYRVRLGPLDSPEEADAMATRLGELGFTAARVYLD